MAAANRERRRESGFVRALITLSIVFIISGCGGGGGGENKAAVDDINPIPATPQTWYADMDNDGFGDINHTIEAGLRPDGYLSDHTDCEDLDPTIHPNATEICGDGIDQDCSGEDLTCEADDDPVQIWYADMDDDGFGDLAASVEAVLRPHGYVSDHTDCQDLDPNIHPNASEICGDGIDQDCSGGDLACDPAPFLARFGIITDIHHSNRPDSTRRKYSAALDKAAYFVARMDQEELDWLEADLSASDLPTIIFSHQALHLDGSEAASDDFIIKNAAVVRSLLEADGQVLAAFSGHDHRGATTVHYNIHYFGLAGNVGLECDWSEVSPTNGLDPIEDSPFTLVEIKKTQTDELNKVETFRLELLGNAQQYSYVGEVQVAMP